ncbi:MAG: nitroreductase family protein [Deltaproteobacteria bacterium]|jgi:hypothetical protein|nr:nitroreductase family protein [Deltaproteobacteria bacterium]
MKIISHFLLWCLILPFLPFGAAQAAAAADVVHLPAPDRAGGVSLMQAINMRHSNRNIKPEAISEAELSSLLWAAWGINRNDGRRTVPTAKDEQKVNLYVALESGIWLYEAKNNNLRLVQAKDMRSSLSNAPVTLIYAAPANVEFSGMHIGSMYQNAALYCASAGLANIVKVSGIDVLRNLPLPSGYKVMIIQSVGKPG